MKALSISVFILAATTTMAAAQVSNLPTPGQAGTSAAPGTSSSSSNNPNNRGATQNKVGSGMSEERGKKSGAGASPDNLTNPQTNPAEKSPQRNDATPNRQKNTP
jgi:hypothetical protein